MRDRKSDQHRTATARRLGRALNPDEVVHHANENKADNSPANLSVEGRSAHTAKHNRARGVSRLRRALTMHLRGEKVY